ncbi:aminotransferase class V-fold PLP-dependent enzyme [Lacticaseibacillus absianus]|uniref:aminotransferase class V-fold PLP-dependent enzyme n=1 Tax=Lacticaseibacillus absianus TaxID=2729623 RepID=UPI0015C8CEEF|nr:cysteine desulfurase [Lacticaseibacillus absianus]
MREQFPFFAQHPDLVYLDTAATSQKPQVVLDALRDYYLNDNANVHRGLYQLAFETTERYEAIRAQVAAFVNAAQAEEIVFTRGTTDSLNLVAGSFGPQVLQAGDEVLVSASEHHSNFIPWQQLAERVGARFVVAPVQADGNTDPAALAQLITPRTRLLAIAQVTNVAGGLVPVRALADRLHAQGGIVVVDGAQSVAHMPVDVQAMGADFFAFSGHKVYGPTGIGVLYGRRALLAAMPPAQFGGEMIDEVTDAHSTWAPVPLKFEAGTPDIAGVFGLSAALTFLQAQDWSTVRAREDQLIRRLRQGLAAIDGLTLYGTADSFGIVSFNLTGVHPHDLATFLDEQHIAVRAGHHCAQPLMARLGVPATVRASLGLYNDASDIDRLIGGVAAARGYFLGTD